VRPGVVQLVVAICDRQPRTKGPLRTAVLEPSQSFWRLHQVLEPRLAPLIQCAHTSAPWVMRGACMHARESAAPNRA
jgi:hypothetical protein